MFTRHIDADNQKFIIEDRDGKLVAERPMPAQRWPNPGREVLMTITENLDAWELICDMVALANEAQAGREREERRV